MLTYIGVVQENCGYVHALPLGAASTVGPDIGGLYGRGRPG